MVFLCLMWATPRQYHHLGNGDGGAGRLKTGSGNLDQFLNDHHSFAKISGSRSCKNRPKKPRESGFQNFPAQRNQTPIALDPGQGKPGQAKGFQMEGDGSSCRLDRPEAGAGDFRFLGEFADQVESAGIGQGIEDVGEVEIGWMVEFGHGKFLLRGLN